MYNISMFESNDVDWNDGRPTERFNNITTNGIACGVVMSRPKQEATTTTQRLNHNEPINTECDFLVGIDPGVREVIGGVRRDIRGDAEPDLVKNEMRFLVHSRQWRDQTGANDRKLKLTAWTGELEKTIRSQRELLQNIGQFHPDFMTFTRFELSFFRTKCEAYFEDKVTRLGFDKIIRTEAAASQVANELCPAGFKTFVAFGDANVNPNLPIKG
jgi:hypothetical protein